MAKKKILILYSTVGMGHKKAAMAIFEAFKGKTTDIDIEIIDVIPELLNKIGFFVLN